MVRLYFIYSSVTEYMACFSLLALVNNTAMNMGVQISLGVSVFNSFGNVSRNSTGASYGSLKNCHAMFIEVTSFYIPSLSDQRFPFPPHPHVTCYLLV